MIVFFKTPANTILAVETEVNFGAEDANKLCWLFDNAEILSETEISGEFIGPRREMITPWSTNAVEITQNMGLKGIKRIEEYYVNTGDSSFDPMLQRKYSGLDQELFTINKQPEPIVYIEDIVAYNQQEGLALNADEIAAILGVDVNELSDLEDLASNLGKDTVVTTTAADTTAADALGGIGEILGGGLLGLPRSRGNASRREGGAVKILVFLVLCQ